MYSKRTYIIMVFKQVGTDVDKLSLVFKKFWSNFGLFNKSFTDIGKDFKNGIGIRSLTNFVSKQDIQSLNNFNRELTQGVKFSEAFRHNLSNSHTYVQKQAVAIARLNNQQKILQNQLNANKITQEQYNTAMAANKAQMTALTTGTQKLTLAQKASAVASKIMGTALNLALNVGFMLIINAIITGITKLVNKQKELREETAELAVQVKEETDNLKDLIKSYEEFADKTSYTAEEKERLTEIQQQLVDTYHFEAEGIDLVNGKYDEEIAKLKELQKEKLAESKSSLIAERTYAQNDFKNVSGKELNTKIKFQETDFEISSEDYRKMIDRISKDTNHGDGTGAFYSDWGKEILQFSGTAEQRVKDIKSVMKILEEYGYSTTTLYAELNTLLEDTSKLVDTYDEATLNLADNIFQSYELDNPFSQVGQDSYLAWRNGLLKSANGDTYLQSALLSLIEKQFPDYSQYFKNLDFAKDIFGLEHINSASDGAKLSFLNSLSPEDLEIATKIPDLFEDGLEGATRKIEEWKQDNPIEAEVEISVPQRIETETGKIKLLTTAMEDMNETGYLSSETYADILEAGDDFLQFLKIQDGRLTLDTDAMKEYAIQELETAKATNNLALAQLNLKAASLASGDYNAHKEEIQAIGEQIQALIDENALLTTLQDEYRKAQADGGSGKTEDPEQVTKFLNEYNRRQHEIAMGRMAEDQDYYDWLASAAEKAYAGLKDYEEDLWKYQEEVYEGRKQLADDYLNDRIEDREAQIEITLDTSKADDGTKLNTKEKFDYVRDCYREILAEIETRINDLIQSGVATNSEAIQELEKQAQEYRDKLDGVLTDEIETEIDYLKNMQDEWDKVYDDKIDAIEKEKSAMEERYDSEIEALQKANDEKQKEYDIEKARQELEKASQRTRKVYGADGTVGYRQDTEAVTEAQKNLDDLLVEKQIEALEEQKKLETEKFDKQIELLEQEQTAKQEFYNKLLEILENYLNPKATESNSNVWESVLGDTENVKKSNGNVEVKGTDVDTSSLKKGILNSIDIINWLEKLGASTDIIKAYANGTGNATTMSMQTSMNNTASKQFDNQHKTSAWSASRDDYKINTGSHSENITYSIGDVHIHKPVGDVDSVAKEVVSKLNMAIQKQTYTNIKK